MASVGYGKVHGYTGSKLWAFGIQVEHPRRIKDQISGKVQSYSPPVKYTEAQARTSSPGGRSRPSAEVPETIYPLSALVLEVCTLYLHGLAGPDVESRTRNGVTYDL